MRGRLSSAALSNPMLMILGFEASRTKEVIKATKPKSTKVYSSLAQWRRGEGTEIGLWVGNFDYLNAADAADDNAFALSSTDHRWNYITATSNAWIPAFRCYLSSSSIEKNTYQSRFTE